MSSTPTDSPDDATFEQNRRDQLTTAPESTEADAAPRIDVSEHDGTTRIDVRDDAEVRPGPGPGMPEAAGE
ncbi:multidrug transporter [Microbacterium sp. NPDC008134]|uniref:multidrug transporter n=1 Tax=Microbacterium sp. NPDC008134 TaxID=3364183 RepID=UPI0036F192A0